MRRDNLPPAVVMEVPSPASGSSAPLFVRPWCQIIKWILDSDERTKRFLSLLVPSLNCGCLTVLGVAVIVTVAPGGEWWGVLCVFGLGASIAATRYRRRLRRSLVDGDLPRPRNPPP